MPPFRYQLSLRAGEGHASQGAIWVGGMTLQVLGTSTRMAAGDSDYTSVHMEQRTGPGVIDLRAVEASRLTPKGGDRGPAPDAGFRSEVNSLWVPPDRPVLLRVRFKGSEELFVLRHEREVKKLRLEALRAEHGHVGETASVPYTCQEVRDGGQTFQCSPMSVCALRGGLLLWERPLAMKGQPERLRVVGQTLFGTTTAGHSFYLSRRDGALIFYHDSRLTGMEPVEEVLALGRKAMAQTGKKESSIAFPMMALVRLGDKRAVPFLIDGIAKGYGLSERAMAVAGLEKFNGNDEPWSIYSPGHPESARAWHGRTAMRLFRPEQVKAEQEKWRRVFGLAAE